MKKFFVCSIVAISMMAGIGVPSVALATSRKKKLQMSF